jgi:hypothetical protein
MQNRQVVLKAHPNGAPTPADFGLSTCESTDTRGRADVGSKFIFFTGSGHSWAGSMAKLTTLNRFHSVAL